MATYSNTMRLTGLSGLDTESMVQQLMKAESMRLVSLKKTRQSTIWKQEQYRNSAKILKDFQNNFLSMTSSLSNNFKSATNYKNFATEIKGVGTDDTGKFISIQAADAAKTTGTYNIKVDKIASKDVFKSQNSVYGKILGSDEFDATSIRAGDSFNISLDGISKTIKFDEQDFSDIDTASDKNAKFVDIVNKKLAAMFGTEPDSNAATGKSQKVQISITGNNQLSITTLPGHTATISGGSRTTNVSSADTALDLSSDAVKTFSINIEGDATPIEISVSTTAKNDSDKKLTDSQFINALNKQLTEKGVKVSAKLVGGKITFTNSNADKSVTISGATTLGFSSGDITLENSSVFSNLGIASGATTKLSMKSSLAETFGVSGPIEFSINNVEFKLDSSNLIEEVISKINRSTASVKLSFDDISGQFTLESTSAGAANAINIKEITGEAPNGFQSLMGKLGFSQMGEAQDAIININGVPTTRTSNDITIDGIRIGLTKESEGQEYNISFKQDTSKTVDFIRKFVDEYNKLVDDLKGYYGTPRPKSDKYTYYLPLSDDEKEAMSDKQIEQYETKAQEGLLYNDPILRNIASSMRSMLYEPVKLNDGREVSLFEFGITTTTAWNDGGKIEINTTKLEKAIAEHGDDLAALFTKGSDVPYGNKANAGSRRATEGIAERLDDIIKDAIYSNGSIYNKAGIIGAVTKDDLTKLISSQDDKISEMLVALSRKENYYYQMFAKLETAMNDANSQMLSLQSMLGQY